MTGQGEPNVMRFASARHLAVLRFVREHGTVTRAEIGAATGLSVSQVSRLTSDLIERGWVVVERRLASIDGRPADVLALAGETHFVVGLDVGGVAQQAVVANLRGEVVASRETNEPLSTARAAILDHVEVLVGESLHRAGVEPQQVLGLGVGLRAVVDPVRGVITGGPETPAWSSAWIDFPIRDELARRFPWERIAVDDTVRALGVAEARYGHGRGEGDFVYVLADTGIGAALMIGNRPYIGPSRIAGELGHVTLDPAGERCGCGRRGCLETVASSSALLRRGRDLTGDSTLSLPDLIRRGEAGDAALRDLLAAGGAALGRGVATVLNLLAPRLVVVGGAATASDRYLDAVIAAVRAQALPQVGIDARIVRSELGPLAGAAGAGTMILDAMFDQRERGIVRRRTRVASSRHQAGDELVAEGEDGHEREIAGTRVRSAPG